MKAALFYISFLTTITFSSYAQFEYRTIVIDSIGIQFKFAKDDLLAPQKDLPKLQSIRLSGQQTIKITSYTDTVGSVIYNDTLSMKRLRKVVSRLEHLNLTSEQLSSKSEQRDHHSQLPDSLFRRVDIIIYENQVDIEYGKPYPLQINFDGNQHFLRSEAKVELIKLVQVLQTFPQLHIELHGHISGRTYSNSSLSLNRSLSTKAFLVEQGIDEKRINCLGFQNTRPLKIEMPGQNFPENRRVEVIFVEPQ